MLSTFLSTLINSLTTVDQETGETEMKGWVHILIILPIIITLYALVVMLENSTL